jgi:DNA-binding MarR family transcriptional regulator
MADYSAELLDEVRHMRKLLELIAEPAVAQRDAKLRQELGRIVGRSKPKQQSVLLMNGKHRQTDIQSKTGINKGHLSTLVSRLSAAELLTEGASLPNLVISIPENFFDIHAETD